MDLQEEADVIQGWDKTGPSEKNDPRANLTGLGASGDGGHAFAGRCAGGVKRSGLFGSGALTESGRLPMAGSARGAGLLACGLHAVSPLGKTRGMAAPV